MDFFKVPKTEDTGPSLDIDPIYSFGLIKYLAIPMPPPTARSTRSSEALAPTTPKLLTKVNGASVTKAQRGRPASSGNSELEKFIFGRVSAELGTPKQEPYEHMKDVHSHPKVEAAFEDIYIVIQILRDSLAAPEDDGTQIIGMHKSLELANTAARLALFRHSDKDKSDGKLSSWQKVNQKILDNGCVHIWAQDGDYDISIRVAEHRLLNEKPPPEVWMVESTVMEQYPGNKPLAPGQGKINTVECLGIFKDVEGANRCALKAALDLNRDDMSEHAKPGGPVDLHFKGQPGYTGKPEVKIMVHAKKVQ